MPRAYNAMIRSLNPSSRVWPLRTICGSKLPLRSRGTARSTAPTSVSSVFGGGAVAAVAAAPAGRVVLVIAQVAGHLLSQGPFQHRLGHLGQQPIRAEQLRALGLGLAQQLIRQLVIDQRPAGSASRPQICGAPSQCQSSRVLPRAAFPCGSSSGHVTYTAGRTTRPAADGQEIPACRAASAGVIPRSATSLAACSRSRLLIRHRGGTGGSHSVNVCARRPLPRISTAA